MMDDKRLIALNDVLASYSLGNFKAKANVSKAQDGLDSIIAGVNMLGEELNETTVSRDYLSGIFNTIAELIFVLTENRIIENYNPAAERFIAPTESMLGKSISTVLGMSIDELVPTQEQSPENGVNPVIKLRDASGEQAYLSCYMSAVYDRSGHVMSHLLVMTDITEQRQAESRILRAVLSAQEGERERIAKDLHDAFGSELGVMRPILTSVLADIPAKLPRVKQGVEMFSQVVGQLVQSIRDICFDIAPHQLANDGLNATLKRYAGIIELSGDIKMSLDIVDIDMDKEYSLHIMRITQEFVHNSIKHGQASQVTLSILPYEGGLISYSIRDNGRGFDIPLLQGSQGRGLENMRTRVQVLGGTFELTSKLGEGTRLAIVI